MKRKIEKLILKAYQLLPEFIQNNQRLSDYVSSIAEKELQQIKHEVIKANWERDRLQRKVSELKHKGK